MNDLKEFIKICNNMYIKQINKIIKLIKKDITLSCSTKNNLIASGELIVDTIKLMNKDCMNVVLPSLRNCYEMTLKGIVLDNNAKIKNSYNKIIKLKEKDGMDNVRRFIGENFSKYFYVIEKDENFEKILGEGILTYVYKILCRYSHATKVNEFVYIAQKDDKIKEILKIYLISMLIYPIIELYVDAVCTKLNKFELDESLLVIYSIITLSIFYLILKNKTAIAMIDDLSKKILGEPDGLLKIRLENEKVLYSYDIEDYKKNIKDEQVSSEEFSKIINNYLQRFFTIKQLNRLDEIIQRNL